MLRTLVFASVALVGTGVIAGTGCGSSEDRKNFAQPDATIQSPTGDAASFVDGQALQPCSGTRCSSDLRAVVDCDGKVVQACPADQGCHDTQCLPACEAAAKSKGSIGCDFYAVDPDIFTGDGAAGGCFAAYVANTWDSPVSVQVEYDGKTLDPAAFGRIPVGSGSAIQYQPLTDAKIPPGEVAILFLNRFGVASPPGLNINCPPGITPAITSEDAAVHGSGIGKSFRIKTDAPVAAYDILPYGGGQSALTSATLLLPTSAWDTNYVAVDAFRDGSPLNSPFVEIVAQQDNTEVTINPVATTLAGGQICTPNDAGANDAGDSGAGDAGQTCSPAVASAPKGAATTYVLHRGQVLQLEPAQAGVIPPTFPSLTGSVIQSNFPVGVWGGTSSLGIFACCADSAHQQIPPVRALGNEYVGVRYRNRFDGVEEVTPWRLVGAVDGTILTWDPVMPNGTKTLIHRGEVMEFLTNGPFIVKSQDSAHPFYMGAHMTGSGVYDKSEKDSRGDPEWVNVVPPGEFMDSYVFFADPTYPETNLVVVRTKQQNGFKDVELDCAGPLTGWQPIGTTGKFEYTRVDLVRHNFAPQGNCNTGRHEMKSAGFFGVTVWGWGSAESAPFNSQAVSYAYPAGASVQPINDVVVVVK